MAYSREQVEAYTKMRFPRASKEEIRRTVEDWVAKPKIAQGIARDFEKRAGALQGKKVLDAGSGGEATSIALSLRGAHVEGVDIEEELVAIAKEEAIAAGSSVHFTYYEGTTLPFPDDSFDAALSVSVIEHVEYPVRYFSEILRTVKPGGVLYLAFPNRLYPRETHTGLLFLSYLPRSLAQLYLRLTHSRPLEDHGLHFYTFWSVRRLIRAAGSGSKSWRIRPEPGSGTGPLTRAAKGVLRAFGIPHQALLPHVMLILECTKS
jgi:SAM-dependent methyltransferase